MTAAFAPRPSLEAYFARHPGEAARFDWLDSIFGLGERLLYRDCLPCHWTASAWIVDEAHEEALILFHRKLQRWIQPGGHADGDADLPRVALREAQEETGLTSLRLASEAIFDFDVTPIPARAELAAHSHLDMRFLIRADRRELIVESTESAGARWVRFSQLDALCGDAGISRMAAKTPR